LFSKKEKRIRRALIPFFGAVFIGLVIGVVILDPISDNNQDTKKMIYFVLLSAGMIAILVFEHDMIQKWLENKKEENKVLRDYYWEQEQRKNPLFKYYSEESLEEMKKEIVKELLFREEYVKKIIDGEEIGEGFSELAGFITKTQPSEWNNITPFARDYFSTHPDDSLLFWNLYSQQYDVRIDYGGVYLFSLYFYEQFGSSVLKQIVIDSANGAESLNILLNAKNTSFNEFFSQWQIALIGEHFDDESFQIYSYKNIDFSIEPVIRINQKNIFNTLSIPYYGVFPVLFDLSDEKFDVTLYNNNLQLFSIAILTVNENTDYVNMEIIQTSNQSISLFSDFKNINKAILCISAIDHYTPMIDGDIGIGNYKTLSIYTSNPYELSINNPIITQNNSYLSIHYLSIFLWNGTDIYFSEGDDVVILQIQNESSVLEYEFYYNAVEYNGWSCNVKIENLQPGFYQVYLYANTGEYLIEILLYEFTIEIEVDLNKPEIFFNKNNLHIKDNIVLIPNSISIEILSQIKVYAYIYNITENFIANVTLDMISKSSWEGVCDFKEYENGEYFTVVIFEFGKQLTKSHPSNTSSYKKINTSFNILLIVSFVTIISIFSLYIIGKKRWR
jgi:hypothetical protein